MNIVVITGSPHREGTSAFLADRFIKGAEEAGHEVFRFDSAFEKVHPCIACDKCREGEKSCVFQDDMRKLNPYLLKADLIAFVTPLYFYGMSAQIKAVIDRFYANDTVLCSRKGKAVLMVTAADDKETSMRGVAATYEEMLDYMGWTDCGRVLAIHCGTKDEIENSDYPKQAEMLGKGL